MIGWALSVKPDAELVIKALDMAYEQRGKPQQVLFPDQGSQYTSSLFRQRLWRYRMEQSMSRRGISWDAVAESFSSSLKKERIRKRIYKTRDLARAGVFDYIEVFYNRTRRHSHLGGISP